jgi:CIC family chloride channel protein
MVSFFISSRLQRQPIYEALALQDGIHLPSAETSRRHVQRQVVEAMRAATEVLPAQMTVREAFERVHSSEFQAWPVTDQRGVVGVVSLAQLEQALVNGEGTNHLKGFIDARDFPHVHADQPLHLALERMGAAKLDVLPVVSRANIQHLEGIVVRSDVLDSYGVERRESADLGP